MSDTIQIYTIREILPHTYGPNEPYFENEIISIHKQNNTEELQNV